MKEIEIAVGYVEMEKKDGLPFEGRSSFFCWLLIGCYDT